MLGNYATGTQPAGWNPTPQDLFDAAWAVTQVLDRFLTTFEQIEDDLFDMSISAEWLNDWFWSQEMLAPDDVEVTWRGGGGALDRVELRRERVGEHHRQVTGRGDHLASPAGAEDRRPLRRLLPENRLLQRASLAAVRKLDFVELAEGDAQFIFLNPKDPTYIPPTENRS